MKLHELVLKNGDAIRRQSWAEGLYVLHESGVLYNKFKASDFFSKILRTLSIDKNEKYDLSFSDSIDDDWIKLKKGLNDGDEVYTGTSSKKTVLKAEEVQPQTETSKEEEIVLTKSELDGLVENAVDNKIKETLKKKSTPKEIKNATDLNFFKCSCGGIHYRHAGYVQIFMPFVKGSKEGDLCKNNEGVYICVKCKKAYVWEDSQQHDVTSLIDLEAWEKLEVETNKATGPGGQC